MQKEQSLPLRRRRLKLLEHRFQTIDFGEVLADIECPTLVLQPQNQTLRVEAAGSMLAGRIRNSQLVTPPGGQMLPLFEAEGPAIKLFDDFLA